MGRMLKRWAGRITSHGIHLITGDRDPSYGVHISIELEREEGRYVDVVYDDAEDAEYFGHSMVHTALTTRMRNIQYAFGRFKNSGGQTDVHTRHCCDRHGCKYGYDGTEDMACPVVNGTKPQEHICEQCDHELEEAEAATRAVLDLRNERAKIRRARG